jgi:hypothetical protein
LRQLTDFTIREYPFIHSNQGDQAVGEFGLTTTGDIVEEKVQQIAWILDVHVGGGEGEL